MEVKKLTVKDSGNTATVTKGETISLTLSNPGDGGYQFNDAEYKSSVLTLTGHTHQNGNVNSVGDAGKDTWEFKAKASGTTSLEITASRGADKLSLFANQITVK